MTLSIVTHLSAVPSVNLMDSISDPARRRSFRFPRAYVGPLRGDATGGTKFRRKKKNTAKLVSAAIKVNRPVARPEPSRFQIVLIAQMSKRDVKRSMERHSEMIKTVTFNVLTNIDSLSETSSVKYKYRYKN